MTEQLKNGETQTDEECGSFEPTYKSAHELQVPGEGPQADNGSAANNSAKETPE